MKYNIGDKVYWASRDNREKHLTCPDCFGKLALTVILGDDTRVSIPCVTCAKGYEPPVGYITYWEWYPSVQPVTVTGCTIRENVVPEYYVDPNYVVKETALFSTLEEARVYANKLCEEENNRAIEIKEKPTRTWAGNISHYRSQIKRSEKDIAYYTAKLNAAKAHVKAYVEAEAI